MSYQLMIVKNPGKGRNKRVGSLQRLPDGRLGAFVGYCVNNQCNTKVCMDFDSARVFTSKYRAERRRPINRLLLNMIQRLEAQSR